MISATNSSQTTIPSISNTYTFKNLLLCLIILAAPLASIANEVNSKLPMNENCDNELVVFVASVQGEFVKLDWTTKCEEKSHHFSIERSVAGSEYEEILVVKAAGTKHSESSYSITDTEPVHGIASYRLKQTATDGSVIFH